MRPLNYNSLEGQRSMLSTTGYCKSQYFNPDRETLDVATVMISGLEILVMILSVVATGLHYKGAKRLNRVALFHLWHSFYCIWTVFIFGYDALWNFRVTSSAAFGVKWETCQDLILGNIWFMTPMDLSWLVTSYYFFAHFDRILIGERQLGRRGRLRLGVYVTFGMVMTSYAIIVSSLRYSSFDDCATQSFWVLFTNQNLVSIFERCYCNAYSIFRFFPKLGCVTQLLKMQK